MLNIPATVSAPLPATYEAARSALAQCQAIDECKEWADKAAALASYARQSEDLELEKMAIRIRDRATRRAGELLKQIPPGKTGPKQLTEGTHTQLSRTEIAQRAGMSEHQQVTAVRVANIPKEEFDRQVESANPPTLTELARQGTQKRDAPTDPQTWLKGRSPQDFNAILHMMSTIEEYAKEADTWPLNQLLGEMTDKERQDARKWIARIDAIHDQIMTRI
jgi:hypothetical protein